MFDFEANRALARALKTAQAAHSTVDNLMDGFRSKLLELDQLDAEDDRLAREHADNIEAQATTATPGGIAKIFRAIRRDRPRTAEERRELRGRINKTLADLESQRGPLRGAIESARADLQRGLVCGQVAEIVHLLEPLGEPINRLGELMRDCGGLFAPGSAPFVTLPAGVSADYRRVLDSALTAGPAAQARSLETIAVYLQELREADRASKELQHA